MFGEKHSQSVNDERLEIVRATRVFGMSDTAGGEVVLRAPNHRCWAIVIVRTILGARNMHASSQL